MSTARRVGGLLLVAFLLRLGSNLWLTVPTPGIDADALWYHSSATSLAAGEGYVHHFTRLPTAAWPPGYPAMLAAVYRLFGADPAWAFLLNVVAGTLSCWLAGRIALAIASTRAQLLATGLLAVAPSHILFASLVMSETVYTTMMTGLVLGAIVLVRRGDERVPWGGWLGWGAAVGIASLVRAEAVVLLAAPLVVLATTRMRARHIAAIAILVVAGAFFAELPWLVRNARVFGRVVPVSTSFGRTFLIGHNPVADGDMNLYSPDPEADQRDLATGGPARELAVDERLRDAGLEFMREHPGEELRLIGKRFYNMFRSDRVWSEWYIPADPARVPAGAIERLGQLSNLYYWLLLLVAAPAFVRSLRRADSARLLLSLVVISWSAFFVVLLYGSQRFHFPLLPLLCVLAADTLCRGWAAAYSERR